MCKLKFEILNDGQTLRVMAENQEEFLQFIADHSDDMLTEYTSNSDMAFMELTESYSTNGWFICTADYLGQMSECFVICQNGSINDDGNATTLNGKTWTNIHNYQIVSPLYLIAENGFCDFQLWGIFTNEVFKVM